MAKEADHAGPDRMHRLLNRCVWDLDEVPEGVRNYVVEHVGDPEAALIVDDTGFRNSRGWDSEALSGISGPSTGMGVKQGKHPSCRTAAATLIVAVHPPAIPARKGQRGPACTTSPPAATAK